MIREEKDQNGYSLVELMVAMAVFSIFAAGLYSTYHSQIKAHTTQRVVIEMQQNIRNAIYLIERDLRMAGYDLLDTVVPPPGIGTAQRGRINFTMDIAGGDSDGFDNDGDTLIDEADESGYGNGDVLQWDENIWYTLQDAGSNAIYADGECVMPGPCNLVRDRGDGQGWQPVALNIDALNFVYLDEAGNDLTNYTLNPPAVPAAQLTNIRSIQISLVARSGTVPLTLATRTVDDNVYTNQRPATENSPWHIILPAQNDNFHRIYLTSNVLCRNLGI